MEGSKCTYIVSTEIFVQTGHSRAGQSSVECVPMTDPSSLPTFATLSATAALYANCLCLSSLAFMAPAIDGVIMMM